MSHIRDSIETKQCKSKYHVLMLSSANHNPLDIGEWDAGSSISGMQRTRWFLSKYGLARSADP